MSFVRFRAHRLAKARAVCGRQDRTLAETRRTRVVVRQSRPAVRRSGLAKHRDDRERVFALRLVREIGQNHLGAQAIERKALEKIAGFLARRVEKKALAVLHDKKIEQDLALRRQKRAEAGRAGHDLRHVAGDEALQEAAGFIAGNGKDNAVGE